MMKQINLPCLTQQKPRKCFANERGVKDGVVIHFIVQKKLGDFNVGFF
jgi:hypothetical protein